MITELFELALLAAAVLAVGIFAYGARQLPAFVLGVFFLSIFAFSRSIFRIGAPTSHVGITSSVPSVWIYSLVLVAVALVSFAAARKIIPAPWVPAILFVTLGAAFVWPASPAVISGSLHYLWAGLAAGMGGLFAGRLLRGYAELAWVIFGVAVVEAAFSVFQMFGTATALTQLFAVNEVTSETTAGRISGTTDHPGTLGKLVFLLIMVALPLLGAERRDIRRLGAASLGLFAIPLVFSEGRANFVAALTLLLAWPIVSAVTKAKSNFGPKKAVVAFFAGLVAISSLGIYLARFSADPMGGPREHLMEVALKQIELRPWIGTGPNLYIPVVGAYDPLTANGWPVHNAVILAVAELGLIGGFLVFVPFLIVTGKAFKLRAASGYSGEYARVWLSAIPGFAVIAFTGWGLLGGSTFVLFSFVTGFFWVVLSREWSGESYLNSSPNLTRGRHEGEPSAARS
ncbi:MULTISPECIES: O-antigen ligase family protein [Rhodococcus]|uniref:O-antigen ligase family protein n=1 Tax=Rhodococcus TaxID=1827 RepID=UPI0011868856|nr:MULTISPECIES: hypothetical protein [Rhodococcus]